MIVLYEKINSGLLFFLLLLLTKAGLAAVPADLFFNEPKATSVAMSPDGDYLAVIRVEEDSDTLILISSKSREERVLLDTREFGGDEKSRVHNLKWLDDRNIAIQLVEFKTGIEDLLDSKIQRRLLIVDIEAENPVSTIKSVRTPGWLISPLRDKDGHFLFAKSGYTSRIYEISVEPLHSVNAKLGKLDKTDGGQFTNSNVVSSVSGYAVKWFLDKAGMPHSVLYLNRDKEIVIGELAEDKKVTDLRKWKFDDDEDEFKYLPIAKSEDASSYYCLDIEEEVERTVYKIDFSNNSKEIVYESKAYKIVDLILSDSYQLQAVKVLKEGVIDIEYLDADQQQNAGSGQRNLQAILGLSRDQKKKLVYTEGHDKPGVFTLVAAPDSKANIQVELYPGLGAKLKTRLLEGKLEIDGLNIPWLLTLPSSNPPGANGHPLIVMPHGGPFGVYDNPYYDPLTQFWAANGYAVLRVNYRGSGGYNEALRESGKKEWGGKILKDIHEVTRHVSALSDIDAQKVCVGGFSYGGYAASMLGILYPETYRCIFSLSGVYDINFRIHSAHASTEQIEWMKEYIGDPETEYDKLKNESPLFRLQELRLPVFIGHGEKDSNVDIEQASRFIVMLEKFKKVHEVYIDEEAGHSFTGHGQMSTLMEKVLSFVDRHM